MHEEKTLIEEIKEYITANGFTNKDIPFKDINVDEPIHTNKGCGYLVSFKGYSMGMCVYIEQFEEMKQIGASIKEIAEEFMWFISDNFSALMSKPAIKEEDLKKYMPGIEDKMIITCQYITGTENTENKKHQIPGIFKENKKLGIVFFIKTPMGGDESSNLYMPVTEKMLGHKPTKDDWEKAHKNTMKKASLQFEMETEPDSPVKSLIVYDEHQFADCFYLQIPLKEMAKTLKVREILLLPIDPYCVKIMGISLWMPDDEISEIHASIYDPLSILHTIGGFLHAYIYKASNDSLEVYEPPILNQLP